MYARFSDNDKIKYAKKNKDNDFETSVLCLEIF